MASQLPDILKVKPQAILSNMDIDSHILEPEVSTARHMTFKLPKVGILDQGSQVQLGITVPQISGKDEAFFPGLTGIAALIEKAELEVAGKVLATSDDFAYYHTMRRSYKHPEERAFVDSLKEGVWADRVAFQTVGSTAGLLALRDVDYASASGNGTVPSHLKMTSSATTSPLFSLSLSQLFPAFTSKQLPLFAIKDHVLIKLTFRQQFPGSAVDRGLVFQCPSSVTDASMPQFSINAANCKFVCDAIHYNQQTMADVSARAMSDSGLSMIYEDLILTRATIGNTTAPSADTQSVTQSYDRQLATVGRAVRNIIETPFINNYRQDGHATDMLHATSTNSDGQLNKVTFIKNGVKYPNEYDLEAESQSVQSNPEVQVMMAHLDSVVPLSSLRTTLNQPLLFPTFTGVQDKKIETSGRDVLPTVSRKRNFAIATAFDNVSNVGVSMKGQQYQARIQSNLTGNVTHGVYTYILARNVINYSPQGVLVQT